MVSPWMPNGNPQKNQSRPHRTGLAGPLPCSGLVANAAVCSWCRSISGDWDDFERGELGCPKIMGKPWENMGQYTIQWGFIAGKNHRNEMVDSPTNDVLITDISWYVTRWDPYQTDHPSKHSDTPITPTVCFWKHPYIPIALHNLTYIHVIYTVRAEAPKPLDGFNLWPALQQNLSSLRSEIYYGHSEPCRWDMDVLLPPFATFNHHLRLTQKNWETSGKPTSFW